MGRLAASFMLAGRALAYRNFRLFFIGQGFSLIGTWMQSVALSWLTYRLTGSAFLLGLVAFSSQMPAAIMSPFAGVMVDRWDRRRLLIATEIVAMAQAFALAALSFTGVIAVWHIIALTFLLGIVNAFDIPARQTFLLDMVEDKQVLPNAISLQSSLFNSTRLIGPSVAGILIALWGESVCFLVNGLSYVGVLLALAGMRIRPAPRAAGHASVMHALKEGFRYTFDSLPMRYILILVSVTSLTGVSAQVLLPVFAKDILHGGPRLLGALTAAVGVGALTGALTLAVQKSVLGLSKKLVGSVLLFGGGLMLFAYSSAAWLSVPLLFIVGFGMMSQMASSNIILQTISDDDKRGRVMSFYTLSFMGAAPIGSLLVGALATRFGAPFAILLSGCVCLAAALTFGRHVPRLERLTRPIYVQRGAVKEVARGIEAASELMAPPEE